MTMPGRDAKIDEFWSHFEDRRVNWRDGGPRSDLLESLSAEERASVEARLLSLLADSRNHDDWVPMALGALRSTAAERDLRRRMASERESYRVAAAEAVWRITRDSSVVSTILDVLFPRGVFAWLYARISVIPSARIAAVVALGGIDSPEADRGIARALTDHNFFVRSSAERAELRRRTGLTDEADLMRAAGWTSEARPDGSTLWAPPARNKN